MRFFSCLNPELIITPLPSLFISFWGRDTEIHQPNLAEIWGSLDLGGAHIVQDKAGNAGICEGHLEQEQQPQLSAETPEIIALTLL